MRSALVTSPAKKGLSAENRTTQEAMDGRLSTPDRFSEIMVRVKNWDDFTCLLVSENLYIELRRMAAIRRCNTHVEEGWTVG